MTDEERRELVQELRDPSIYVVTETCSKAAEEIERLAKSLVDWKRVAREEELKTDEWRGRCMQAERERDELKAEQSRLTEKLAW